MSLGALVAAVAISRWVFRSHYLYDLDSVNFALAMKRFDPRVHQPHPPGYFLYIILGRLLNILFHDANLSLVILSILASCGLVAVLYLMTFEWYGLTAARFAGVLCLLSPLAWFHGIVALTYIVEAFFSALIGYLCWRIICGDGRFVVPVAVTLGISAGIRPSSLLFLAPLFLFSLRKATAGQRRVGFAALGVTVVAWALPMIHAAGGARVYLEGLTSLWRMVPSKTTVFNSSPATSIARAFTIIFIFFLIFGAASFAPIIALGRKNHVDPAKRNFSLVWILPALCFFTFGYLKFVNSGYLLLLLPPACIWLGLCVAEWFERVGSHRSLKLAVIGACAACNVAIFLASPLYCSYGQVRLFETQLENITTAIPRLASPDDTVILSVDSHFNGFRHAGYYLPGYFTIEYPEAKLKDGPRVFTMNQRNTILMAALPLAPYRRFIVFPLPNGSSYREYLQEVTARLPSHDLSRVTLDGHDYVTGPISDLPSLFPNAAKAP
jgi:Protein of unknown function (DUF2723)